jgi:radical SAM superfamily enzyme YgiQ (UPF0313 family)
MSVDILFLHAGGFNPEGLQGPFFPIGVIGLASFLQQNGYKPLIVNLFLEKILNPELDYKEAVKSYAPSVIGIDLHWFVHCYESVELARLCKEVCPSAKIVVGGLTASQFDTEIMEQFPFIDAVIRGDAEQPLLQYLQYALDTGSDAHHHLENIPNLTYCIGAGTVTRSSKSYRISRDELDQLDFLRFDLLQNWQKTFNLFNADYIPANESQRSNDLNEYYNPELPVKAWILYTGRGCQYKCTFCGGSATAFNRAFERTLILRSPEKIADDILRYNETTPVDIIYMPHSPLITESRFHHKILDSVASKLKERGLKKLTLGFIFEDCPFQVDLEILGRYLQLFDRRKSIFRLYLADVEKKTSDFNHFPVDFKQTQFLLNYLSGRAHVLVGILIGLPGQTRSSTLKMADFARDTRKKGAVVMIYNAELHPGSELIQFPEKYHIKLEVKRFMDYYHYLEQKRDKSMLYGYKANNDITIQEQRQILEKAITPELLN